MTNQNITPVEQLVPVFTAKIGDNNTYVCNARDLHSYLESKQDFSTWIKSRIEKYEFQADLDFSQLVDSSVPQKNGTLKTGTYGRNKIDYIITLDMAKELAMVENNQRGREVRRYFIAMEQKAIESSCITHNPTSQDYSTALRNFANAANILASAATSLADEYERKVTVENKPSIPAQSAIKQQLSDSELAFIQAWWECFGSQPVTASDLYRAVATKQCQVLNDSSASLLGNITEWTAKKLSHALRRWSQLILDSYIVRCIGKTSHGLLWQLQLV